MKYKGIELGSNPPLIKLRNGTIVEAARCTVDSVPRYFRYLDVADKIIMDIGGHFGTFTVLAMQKGARSAVVFEPFLESFQLLRTNIRPFGRKVATINAAVVSSRAETTVLWVHPEGHYGANSTTKAIRGFIETKVKAVNFADMLAAYSPEVIKLDCEGAEYDLLLNTVLPTFVKQVYCELHYHQNSLQYHKMYDQLLKKFSRWQMVRQPKDNWFVTEACWRR